ncbi:MAG: hypothetical protein GY784_14685 [Gammaproteobacteria bacterium]|nr:hypothetical protein [Gammaproteobacteria bacterium]
MKSQALLGWLLIAVIAPVDAEFSGNVAAEALLFTEQGKFPEQLDDNLTLSFQPKWSGDWNDGDDSWSAELFMRADSKDDARNRADIRELMWLHLQGDNEWRVGINTMFWGVTESQHLVDVINQIDLVEGVDGEDKLGQPMVHLKRYEDWGVLDVLVLPGFRERTFHAAEGRPRFALVVDGDAAEYESSAEGRHVDYAMRYSHSIDDLDFGISWFKGTNRDPEYSISDDGMLIPYYGQMTQVGIDALLIDEDWIWKLEMIHRTTSDISYEALTGGFEYTFYGVYESDIDLGTLVEYSYDNRPADQRGVFDRDLFLGVRLAFNDTQSTDLLTGMVYDTEKQSQSYRLEGSRRVGQSWKATIEAQVFSHIDDSDVLVAFEDDDYLLIEMARFF